MTRSYCQLAPEMDESNFQTLKLLWDRACKLCRDQINWADYLHQYPTIFQDYIQHPNTTSMINKEKFLSIHNTNTSIWLKMAIFGPNYNIAINIVKLWKPPLPGGEGILLTPELTSGVLHCVSNNWHLEYSIVYLIIDIWSTPLCI